MKTEETNSPEFLIWEERFKRQLTTTLAANSLGPFRLAADSADGADPFLPVINVEFMLYVADTSLFRVGHVIMIQGLQIGNNTLSLTMRCVVTAVSAATKLKVRPISLPAGISTGFANGNLENLGLNVQAIGTSFAQGVVNMSGEVFYLPDRFINYTQIFRTPFSFSRNALMTPTKFDETGMYREKSKQHSLYHMVEMERAFLWGERANYVKSQGSPTDSTTGVNLPEYKTGGILGWYLPQWEIADSAYRGGSGAAALTLDSEDDKRIITNSGGVMNESTFDDYLERIFRKTNNVTNERLAVCGSGALKTLNKMYRALGTMPYKVPGQDSFGMRIVSHECPFGTVYYKTHPLFSEDLGQLWSSLLFLDVHNLRYRPFQKSDTFLRKQIQTPSMDGRMDEWMTEAGLELKFPESFTWMQNMLSYVS
jgi:hypothetical protein